MYEIVVPVLAFLAVVGIGGMVLVARASTQRTLRARIHGSSTLEQRANARGANLTSALEQVGRAVAPEQAPSALREKLVRAGYQGINASAVYVGTQLLLVVVGVAIAAPVVLVLDFPLMIRGCLGFAVVALLGLLPNLVIELQQRARRTEVRLHLPDAIDLLEICVSAGMGLDTAWNAVAGEFRAVSPVLADEMALVNLEIHLGVQRADALRHMAHRTGADEISSLVATLIQSERFGVSVGQALRVYADALRVERSQRAEEAAEKLMVKLLLPMLVFIFPVLFIVILGPAGIKIMDTFSHMGR
jgi:tight adherence protein C